MVIKTGFSRGAAGTGFSRDGGDFLGMAKVERCPFSLGVGV
jgi:hypothetical protein